MLLSTINGLSNYGVTAEAVDGKLEIYSDGTGSAPKIPTLGGEIIRAGDPNRLTD